MVLPLSLTGFALLLYELILVRLLGIVLFGPQAHLAVALALLGGGIGASLLQAFPKLVPASHFNAAMRRYALLMSISLIVVIAFISHAPILTPSEIPPESFQERIRISYDLINTPLYIVLLVIASIPFALGGIILAAFFRDFTPQTPALYASNLIGTGLAAPVFLLLLSNFAATDLVLLVAAVPLLIALQYQPRDLPTKLCIASLALCSVSHTITGNEIFPLRYAAGYAEETLTHHRWTPSSRVSLYTNPKNGERSVVLDNGSASLVVENQTQAISMATSASRGLVYALKKSGKAAIIGAGAGPEVAASQQYGFTDITAIDLVPAIAPLVTGLFGPATPLAHPGVVNIGGDGRAVIAQKKGFFDVIQIVHANIWSLNGVVSNVWSPALLETQQAFVLFFNALTPDGILSVAKGADTVRMIPTLYAALHAQGIAEPTRHIAFLHMGSTVLLVKRSPWGIQELQAIEDFSAAQKLPLKYFIHPVTGETAQNREASRWPVMTDDKPYSDTPMFWNEFLTWLATSKNRRIQDRALFDAPLAYVYSIFVVQFLIVAVIGCAIIFLPLRLRTLGSDAAAVQWRHAAFFFCLGYGFIAIEITLMSALVLLVSEPVVAVAAALFAILVPAGAGAYFVSRVSTAKLAGFMKLSLVSVPVIAGALFFLLPQMQAMHLALSTVEGFVLITTLLFPLAFLLGIPLAGYVRQHASCEFAAQLPWLWGINCWASVLGSFASVLIARFSGYSVALLTGCVMYIIVLLIQHEKK